MGRPDGGEGEGKCSAAQSSKILVLSNIYSALYMTENVKREKSFKWDIQLPIFQLSHFFGKNKKLFQFSDFFFFSNLIIL